MVVVDVGLHHKDRVRRNLCREFDRLNGMQEVDFSFHQTRVNAPSPESRNLCDSRENYGFRQCLSGRSSSRCLEVDPL